MSAEQYGSIVAVYGCQPCDPTPKPWEPPPGSPPWYPGPTVPIPDPPVPPKTTPLNPPKECKYCDHLFATIEAYNDHVDVCRINFQRERRRMMIDRMDERYP
jgi:hypothetical protein